MTYLIAMILLAGVPAQAALPNLAKLPQEFCRSAEQVAEETSTCDDNGKFRKASAACFAKLEALENTFGAEAGALAQTGAASQSAKLGVGKQEYDFSAASLRYLIAAAKVSQTELVLYREVLPLPPDFDREDQDDEQDPYGWAEKVDCYGGTKAAIAKDQAAFGEKIARFEKRLVQAKAYGETLQGSGADLRSLGTAAPEVAPAQKPAAKPPNYQGEYRPGTSDISGTEEKKKSRP